MRGRVDLPRGVVRGIQDDGAGFLIDGRRNAVRIRFEREIHGRHRHQFAAGVADVETVFHEIRTRRDDFFPAGQDRAEKHVDPSGGAAGDDDMVALERNALFGGKQFRKFGAGRRITGIGHIAKRKRLARFNSDFFQRFFHFRRRRQVGIAETVIEHIVRAEFLFQFQTCFEHFADGGGMGKAFPDFL